VDEDPGSSQPTYLGKLHLKAALHDIKVLTDNKRKNKLVVICPRLEEWVLNVAKKSGINVSAYSLSKIPRELHRKLGSNADKLKPLIKDLLALQSPEILFLKDQLTSNQ
jgi:hypothetical protein